MCQVAEDNNFVKIFEPRLQPLLDVHLGSADHFYDYLNHGKNDMVVVYIMLAIGVLILLIACINFINLSTARASKRAVEVGIRKVIGVNRLSLAVQFLGESVLMSITSFLIALAIVQTTLPHLDVILERELEINFSQNPLFILILFISAVIIGILSGMFPAFVLSALGLIGLVSYNNEQRRLEIVVRKVYGGGELKIVGLLSTDLLKWEVLENVFACKFSGWRLSNWDGAGQSTRIGELILLKSFPGYDINT
jgi:hypothetical protein